VSRPWHAVQLLASGEPSQNSANGELIAISHLEPVFGISIVDKTGTVQASYNHKRRTSIGLADGETALTSSGYLAIDKENRILVADRAANRIAILNSSLKRVDELPIPVDGGLKRPWCLYLDEASNRLYVGEHEGGRVLVFDNVLDSASTGAS